MFVPFVDGRTKNIKVLAKYGRVINWFQWLMDGLLMLFKCMDVVFPGDLVMR